MTKALQTRDRCQVKIFMIHGGGDYPVKGVSWSSREKAWTIRSWRSDGCYFGDYSSHDLILSTNPEVPRSEIAKAIRASAEQSVNAELLAALKLALDNLDGIAAGDDAPSSVIRKQARSAISRATGGA